MQKELICISFSADKLKIAYAKGLPGRREVQTLLVKDIGSLSEPDIAQAVKAALNELKIKSRSVICSIPSRSIITKNIEIPSRNPKEIQEIINLQSGRYTPYSREEIIVDYVNIGVYRQNYTKALLIIVPQDAIKRYVGILNLAGLDVLKVAVVPEGICHVYYHISRVKQDDTPASIIHIGADSTDFIITAKNKMIFARNIPIGVQYFLSEKEKFKEKFVEEIKKSLESYQSEDIERTPNKIILIGAIDEIKEIKEHLDKNLYIPTTLISYLEQLPFKRQALDVAASAKEVSFLDVVSPLFAEAELSIDVTPKEIKLKKALEARGKAIIKMGVLSMGAFALICAILISKIYFKTTYLEQLLTHYQAVNKEAESLEKSYNKMSVLKSYLTNRGYSLEVLNDLYSVILEDIYLSHIKFQEGKEFQIKGSSLSMSTVFTLVSNMEKSPYFENVKTRYTTKRKEEDQDLTDFHIVCTLELPEKEAEEEEKEEEEEEKTEE
ncbi:MAG: pilus assembly protein PilM [Candidatus Omnitrophica bacterium]|nr:pilus assembly protein PilM [Candidatus Omnitrophota bacterium]